MNARDEILIRIRSALGRTPAVPTVPRNYRTAKAPGATGDLLGLLADRLRDYGASVAQVSPEGIRDAVDASLGGARRVIVAAGLPEAWVPAGREVVCDAGHAADELDRMEAVITGAALAVAETGTLVLDGSSDQGRRAITLIPDMHVCVLRTSLVVPSVPAALERIDPIRPQTWISGPSATSDIELNRVEGVHGPRKLAVVLVTE